MRLRHWILTGALALAMGAPIVELFDRWDPTLEDGGGGDTEANLVVAALCIGTGVVLARRLVAAVRADRTATNLSRALTRSRTTRAEWRARRLAPFGRAPTPLRI